MQESLFKFFSAFQNLKRGVTKYGLAPHKPILLLSVLQAVRNQFISDTRIYITPELIFLFKSNWNQLVKTQHVSTFSLPFFHLHKEKSGIWKLVPHPGYEAILRVKESISSLSELNTCVQYAVVPNDLFELMKNEQSNLSLHHFLVETYFTESKNHIPSNFPNRSLDELENIVLNEPPEIYRKEMQSFINQREEDEIFLRSSLFKREIPKIYNNTCCISGMRIEAILNISMIDACHIVPFSESYDDTITNGIALCPNLHRAFDRGLISIDESFRVLVSKTFQEEESNYGIRAFEGRKIRLPEFSRYYPLIENIKWHREKVFKK